MVNVSIVNPNTVNVMGTITDYLNCIVKDFKKNTNGTAYLCELKTLNYSGGRIPDYTSSLIQQLYLLRYAYAYGFEYKEMYRQVLGQMRNPKNLSIVSIGCGTMIDYWAATQAIKINRKICTVDYIGIDKVNWNYKFSARKGDKIERLLHNNAVEWFSNSLKFDADVYFFPKSISEFSLDEIRSIAWNFEHKFIDKQKFYLCISLRSAHLMEDIDKAEILFRAIEKNGFTLKQQYRNYYYYSENEKISIYDKEYSYPEEILKTITSLSERCRNTKCCGANCHYDCQSLLNRNPILKTGQAYFQIMPFERRNEQ